MKIRFWMKWLLTAVFVVIASGQVMAQKNIDKLIEEIEKNDDISINTVIKRDTKTKKITSSVKNFNLNNEKLTKQLVAAFEKDEDMADTAMKDMPKGRKGKGNINMTLVFHSEKEKRTYTLDVRPNGQTLVSVIMKPITNSRNRVRIDR